MITPYPAKDKWGDRERDNKPVRVVSGAVRPRRDFPEINREERREY